MAKVNVNTASREDLVGAGVKAEVADELLKLRNKSGRIASVEALRDLKGVENKMLDTLKDTLDFGAKVAKDSADKAEEVTSKAAQTGADVAKSAADAGQRATAAAKEATDKAADVTSRAAQAGAEVTSRAAQAGADVAKSAVDAGQRATAVAKEATDKAADVASRAVNTGAEVVKSATDAGSRVVASAARGSLQALQSVAETGQEFQRQAAASTEDLNRLLLDTINEQTRFNLQAMVALGRAVNWDEIIRVQNELVRANFERVDRMTSRYFQIVRAMMTAGTVSNRNQHQIRRAA